MKKNKNKLTKLLKIGILLFGIFLLLWSCEREETISFESNLLSKLQSQFNPSDFKKIIPYKFEVNWNNQTKKYHEELETYYYEFPIIYLASFNPNNIKMEKKENYSLTYSVFLTQDKNENFNFYISKTYKVKSKKTSYNPKTESNSNSNFTEYIHIIDKEGDMVFAKKVINDKKDGKLFFNKEFKKEGLEYRVQEECNTVTTYHYTDHYTVFSISGNDDIWVYTGSTLNNISMEQQCNSYWLPDVNGGGGGGNTPGKYKNTSGNNIYSDCNSNKSKNYLNKDESPCQIEISVEAIDCGIDYIYDNGIGECVLIEDQIINELTDEKADCVYDHLVKAGINNHNLIRETFIEFGDGNFANANLIYKQQSPLVNSKGDVLNGASDKIGNDYIVILNSDRLNDRAPIEIAKTIIHESLHALLKKHYLSLYSLPYIFQIIQ